jgi:hypothetical protein
MSDPELELLCSSRAMTEPHFLELAIPECFKAERSLIRPRMRRNFVAASVRSRALADSCLLAQVSCLHSLSTPETRYRSHSPRADLPCARSFFRISITAELTAIAVIQVENLQDRRNLPRCM